MSAGITGWAAWHPEKGFADSYEGPLVFADLSASLMADIQDRNEEDGTNNRTGWRAVKVAVSRA